jgi:signal transduction histidine kinase
VEDEIAKTRGLLLNVFSHELKTPLTIIHGYVDLLSAQDGVVSSENLEQITRAMRESTHRLIQLVQDLMLMSTLESGMGQMVFDSGVEALNLKESVDIVILKLRASAQSRAITLASSIDPELMIHSYAPYFSEYITRIVENSIRFGNDNGHVWISAKNSTGGVRLQIKDDGIGIPEREHAQIFQRFHQVDREKNEQQGVGIGLSIAKAVVELHQGEISVESEVGRGSTFTILIPTLQKIRPNQRRSNPGEGELK